MMNSNCDNSLSLQEKLFLLNNTHLFSLPNRSYIHTKNLDWMGEIEDKLSGDEIRLLTGTHQKSGYVISKLTDIPHRFGIEKNSLSELLFFFSQNIISYPCELLSDLTEVIKFIILNLDKMDSILSRLDEEERKCLSALHYSIYMEGIKPRIRAHEIYIRATMDICPADEYLQRMCFNEASILFDEYLEAKDPNYIAFIITMLLHYFKIDVTLTSIRPFVYYKLINNIITETQYQYIIDLIGDTEESSVNILDMISGINEGLHRKDFDYRIILYGKDKLIDNWNRNKKTCSFETDRSVAHGDAIDNVKELRTKCFNQIQFLTREELLEILKDVCDFINRPGEFDFTLTERQNAILIVDKQFKITKICNKENSDFRTIIDYNDDKYICFRIAGDRNIHALSIPDDMEDERKYLIIEDNPNVEFKLKNCEV